MFYFNKIFHCIVNKICWFLLLAIILLLVLFIGFDKVNAAVADDWYSFVELPSIGHAANCNSSSCYTSGITTNQDFGLGLGRNFYYTPSIYTAQNGYGMMWIYNVNTSFKSGYLYSIRTYMCNGSSANYVSVDFTTGNGVTATHNKDTKPIYFQSTATNVVSNVIGSDTIGDGKCGFVTHFFVPSVDSQYVGVQFSTTSSVTASQALIGYSYDSLGLYTPELRSELDDAISSSNLATSEDVDKLNEEIKEMTSEQQQTNEKLDETNDYLKDDSDPDSDISSISGITGIFPPGPVDSLLNIPFNFLSLLINAMGGQCVPLSGEFVFGSTLSIACMGDSFYDSVPDSLMIFLDLIPSTFILISYFKHLYKKIDRAMSLNTNADDEWGVI